MLFLLDDQQFYDKEAELEAVEWALQNNHSTEAVSYTHLILEEERAELLQRIISNLPEMQRRRFLLHYEYEMTYKEIGKIEHCSQQSVGRAVTAAREKIKAEMKKYLNP